MKRAMDIGQALALAFGQFEAGKIGEARSLCRQIEKAKPDFGGVHYLLGLIALRQNQPKRAADSLARALAATPDAPPLHVAMARAQAALGRPDDAIAHYRRALAGVEMAEAHAELADCLRRTGAMAEAAAEYRRALALNPALAEAQNNLGSLLREQGEPQQALAHVRRALDLMPDWPLALNNLGVTLKDLGRREEAADAFRRALALKPGYGLVHANLAALLKDMKQWDEAERQADQAIRLDKANADAWLVLGLIRQGRKDLAGAEQALRKALALRPDLPQAHFCLGELCREAGEIGQAVGHYRRYLDLDPSDLHGAGLAMAAGGAGPAPARAPDAYVASLFDQYAESFDQALVEGLHYRAPDLLKTALERGLERRENLDVLDIGCGTGLCGVVLRPLARRLDGCDLSPRMVEKAAQRKLYDDLAVGDLVALMQARPAGYDLVTAGDVLVYLGDLAPVFAAAAVTLKAGGCFAFSVERTEEEGFILGAHQRYAHSEGYLRAQAQAAGFTVVSLEPAETRYESGQPVPGYVVVLRR